MIYKKNWMGMELKLKSATENLKLLDKVQDLAERSIWGGCKIAEIAN